MDVSKELAEKSTKKSFINHVFDMEAESQNEMLNIVQYSILALVPVLILNKTVQTIFPDVDESKNNVEILLEIMGQTVVMFLGMLFIHRIITYVPTYSNVEYSPFRVTNVVIAFLTIVLSIQSRIGEKANILFDRLTSYFRAHPKESANLQQSSNQGNNINVGNIPLQNSGGFQVNVTPNTHINGSQSLQVQQNNASLGGYEQVSKQSTPTGNEYGLVGGGLDDVMAANEGGSMWGSAF